MISIGNPLSEIDEKLIFSMGMKKIFAMITVELVVNPTNTLRNPSLIPGIWTIMTRRNHKAKALINGINFIRSSLLKNGFALPPDFVAFVDFTGFSVFNGAFFAAGFG
jgi:hypothetical protein